MEPWVKQCAGLFQMHARTLYAQKKAGITNLLKQLSRESGIPYNTLYQWFYETDKPTDIKGGKGGRICIQCKPRQIERPKGKPRSRASRYFGLCSHCRRLMATIEKAEKIGSGNVKHPKDAVNQ